MFDIVGVPEQVEAFCDSWEMDAEKQDLIENMTVEMESRGVDSNFIQFWQLWIKALRTTQPKLLAYLLYMTVRLLEMWRILKSTGSLYLHCDPTCSHYIKIILDGIFGHSNFKNEIVWHYKSFHGNVKKWFPKKHDILFFYTKSNNYFFYLQRNKEIPLKKLIDFKSWGKYIVNNDEIRGDNMPKDVRFKRNIDAFIKRNNREPNKNDVVYKFVSQPYDTVWDIQYLDPKDKKERLGYPTQKPIALLDRIIKASCPENGIVLDTFCGCGTTIYATHEANFKNKGKDGVLTENIADRKWIGIDIGILSTKLVKDTLKLRYNLNEKEHYKISGIPVSIEEAEYLFKQDPFQFENWSIEYVGGFCTNKKTRDGGIDGRIYFKCGKNDMRSMVISVKGGHLNISYIRDLKGVIEREKSWFGGFISLKEPTKGMREEAAKMGMIKINGMKYERLQLLTIKDMIDGKRLFSLPNMVNRKDFEKNKQFGLNF